MAAPQKDTIYIDIDDEITSIIDKLRASSGKIIALVLPKRATMLQSSVNMKLLKKAADDSKKHLVLVTSEAGLLPLAGSIGIHVAKTPQSRPEIPSLAGEAVVDEQKVEMIEEPDDFDSSAAADESVGNLADKVAKKPKPELAPMPIPRAALDADDEEPIELDNLPVEAAEAGVVAEDVAKKPKRDKKLKVPNFNKFRLRLILAAVLLIVLIAGWIIANIVLPKATIVIAGKNTSVNSSLNLVLSTSAKSLDPSTMTLPAHLQQTQKAQSQQVNTTGQKNEGTKATGSVTMTACVTGFSYPSDVPAGTGLSSNGLTYITQDNASFSPAGPDQARSCYKYTSGKISIAAQSGGSNYNVTGGTFSVAGRSDVSATGSASGGTDNIIQVVSQTDIDNATKKLTSQSATSIKASLQDALQQAGYYAIVSTFNAGTPSTTTSANVGDQADTVTVTQTTTYTMFGVQKSDLQSLLDSDVNSQIDTNKQSILNDGLSGASFNTTSQSATTAQVTMQATATAGPHLNAATLKSQVAGKKPGEVQSLLMGDPGVTSVQVHLSPFWVSSVPTKTSKITITFQNTNAGS